MVGFGTAEKIADMKTKTNELLNEINNDINDKYQKVDEYILSKQEQMKNINAMIQDLVSRSNNVALLLNDVTSLLNDLQLRSNNITSLLNDVLPTSSTESEDVSDNLSNIPPQFFHLQQGYINVFSDESIE